MIAGAVAGKKRPIYLTGQQLGTLCETGGAVLAPGIGDQTAAAEAAFIP